MGRGWDGLGEDVAADEGQVASPSAGNLGVPMGETVPGWVVAGGFFGILVGVVVLAGWVLHLGFLKGPVPHSASMKPNAAAGFVVVGVSFMLPNRRRGPTRGRIVAQALVVFVVLLGLFTLCEYLFGWSLGIDQALFKDSSAAAGTSAPGRMSPSTATCFVLCGTALLTGVHRSRLGHALSEWAALVVLIVATVGLLGYLYGVPVLYGFSRGTQMALHTAITFIVLSATLLAAVPQGKVITILTSQRSGGVTVRCIAPVILLLPALGLLRLELQRSGLFGTARGLSLMVVAAMVILSAVTFVTARGLDRTDIQRQAAERARRETEGRYRDLVEALPAIVYIAELGHSGRWHYVSP